MRCGRAQKLIVLAVDGEITPADRRDLDEHVAACQACRRDLASMRSLVAALDDLPMEREVPARVEAATLRRVRIDAAEGREAARSRWWGWLPAPVLAATGVGVLALVIGTRPGTAPEPAPPPPDAAEARRLVRAPEPPPRPAAAPAREEVQQLADAGPAAEGAPQEPPPELAAAPDLFMNLPIIRNMEKLQHFEAISMVELPPNG